MDLKTKTNEELLKQLNNYKIEHSAIKDRMLKDYDELQRVEHRFNEINQLISSRIKGV